MAAQEFDIADGLLGVDRIYRGGLSTTTGDIGYEPYLAKLERSQIYEPRGQLDIDRRTILMDRTPDEPLFESDFPSERQYSKQALGLRSDMTRGKPGLRVYLPEGTFLDHEFMERETRDQGDNPDFKNFTVHSRVRAGGHRFGTDEPLATNEQELAGMKLIRQRAQSMKDARGRLKVFSTSKDGMAAGRSMVMTPDSRPRHHTHDGTLVDSNTSQIYKDATGLIDARTHVSWLTEQDADFKVAKYGQISRLAKRQDFVAARHITEDAKKAPEHMDQRTKLSLAIDLAALMRSKESFFSPIQESQPMGVSDQQKASKLSKVFSEGGFDTRTEESRAYEIIRAIEGKVLRRNGQQHFLDKGRSRIGRSDLQLIITEHATQANRKLGQQEDQIKIRTNVTESGVREDLDMQEGARKQAKFADGNQHFHSGAIAHFKEEEKHVANYKHLKPKDSTQRFDTQQTADDTESHLTKHYRIQNPLYEGLKTGYFEQDQQARIEERPVVGGSFRASKSIKFRAGTDRSKNDEDYGHMADVEAAN